MGIKNIIKTMKEIHPERVILIKTGTFYHQYNKDAYIISYLFGYKIKPIEKDLLTCGFPSSAFNKIITRLEENRISYMIVNRSQDYEVQDEFEFKSKNTYQEYYNKAHKYISKKNKIDTIYKYLLTNINDENIKEKINKIEEILYEI